MKVPSPFINYNHLKMYIFQEQQIISHNFSAPVAKCAWCGEPGGIAACYTRPFPGTPIVNLADLHHWYFKRGSGKPDEILNSPINVVLLHRKCHMDYGQTREMTERCYEFKRNLMIGLGRERRAKYDMRWFDEVR